MGCGMNARGKKRARQSLVTDTVLDTLYLNGTDKKVKTKPMHVW